MDITTDDPTLIARIARETNNHYVRKAAVEKLANQELLAEIAKKDSHGFVR